MKKKKKKKEKTIKLKSKVTYVRTNCLRLESSNNIKDKYLNLKNSKNFVQFDLQGDEKDQDIVAATTQYFVEYLKKEKSAMPEGMQDAIKGKFSFC